MNPSLPGGATATVGEDSGDWSSQARLSYSFAPYGRMQQGRAVVDNVRQLMIDVHLAIVAARLAAPSQTSLEVQLPFGQLRTTSVEGARDTTGVGDLELRVRQSARRWLGPGLDVGLTVGLALPTGEYVERSGAANLPDEAAYVTLGRGVSWALAELDVSRRMGPHAGFAQVAARLPLTDTRDAYAWGDELRATVGARGQLARRLAMTVTSEVSWRGGSEEPDPFTGMRVASANAGGWQVHFAPSLETRLGAGLNLQAGVRVPLLADVTGNQLLAAWTGFVGLSWQHGLASKARAPAPTAAALPAVTPTAGRITVVDYWATWCAPCKRIDAALTQAAPVWPDVEIVRVNASDWDLPDGLPEGAVGLPAIEIFTADGKRARLLVGPDAEAVVTHVEQLRAAPSPTSEVLP